MRKTVLKKTAATFLAAVMTFSLVGCGSSGDDANSGKSNDSGKEAKYGQIKLGEDFTDIKADITCLTHKTDIVDTTLKDYVTEFQKLYPNINIEYEGITDYANDVTMRLSTGDWGDICMIPPTIDKSELKNFFISFGSRDDLGAAYEKDMLNNYAYDNQVYGIPSMANVQGVVYNKKVFADAGVTELPKTPDEFLEALQKIDDNTDAIPLYTNFSAGWTMTAWDAYIDGGATGDADFVNTGLTKGKDPFSDRGNGTGPYAVYSTLYEAVKRGLTEEDPTTTDWEGSKGMLNNGKIGCMVLGSWVSVQAQAAGNNPDDIGYMPFPITVDGKQYAASGPDYCYGINCNSSKDEQIAAMCYVKWLVEKSGFAESQGGISIVNGSAYPDVLSDMEGVERIVNAPAAAGEEDLWNNINNDSELGINSSGTIPSGIVEAATSKTKTFEELVDEWNKKWADAQKANGVTPQ